MRLSSLLKSTQWITTDALLIFAGRSIRGLAYGFLSVMLPLHLDRIGFSPMQIGLTLTIGLAGGAGLSLVAGLFGDRIGRRRLLLAYAILMAGSGTLLAVSESFAWLATAAFIGTLGAGAADGGGFVALEQAVLAQRLPEARRTDGFAIFNSMSSLALALGALLAAVPTVLERWGGMNPDTSFTTMFVVFIVLGLGAAVLYLRLSPQSDPQVRSDQVGLLPQLPSKRIIARLSLLFGVDGFAGGFILQSFVSYWFFLKYGMDADRLGLIFFSSGILAGLSFFAATWLARRIGLINTMVFTHIPASLLLIAMPFAQTLALALTIFLVRTALAQMDVPTRQSYTMAVVEPSERVAAAGATAISRNLARISSPSIAGYLVQAVSLSTPFVIAGGVKTAYCVALWWMFKGIKPPEERHPPDEDAMIQR